jgi:hypothetical protein
LQAKLAYNRIETTIPKRERLAIGGDGPKPGIMHALARAPHHFRGNVRPDQDAGGPDNGQRRDGGLAGSGANIQDRASGANFCCGNNIRNK